MAEVLNVAYNFLTLFNLIVFSSGANKSVPDAAAHPNEEPSQGRDITPPVRKLSALKIYY